MIIDNLTHPGSDPKNGDLVRYTTPGGVVIEKRYFAISPESPPAQETQVTQAELFDLFTDSELQAILNAKKGNAKAEAWMFKVGLLDRFTMSHKLIVSGLNYLENQGIITAERKAQIIALQSPEGN